jgi:hypothetical protein
MTTRSVNRLLTTFALGAPAFIVLMPVARPDRRHPDALVGQWIDLRHTSPTDTMVWVLAPNGDDATLEIRIDPAGQRVEKLRHYGRWRVDGEMSDPVGRRLCFVHRPGRQGGSCIAFRLDTLTTESGTRRHLVLENYRGEHHTQDRELVERSQVAPVTPSALSGALFTLSVVVRGKSGTISMNRGTM